MIAYALTLSLAFAVEEFDGRAFYVGDLHVHTGASGDGMSMDLGRMCPPGTCGAVAGLGDEARARGLDFMAVTDHSNGPAAGEEGDFDAALDQVRALHDPDGEQGTPLVTILGAELQFELSEDEVLGHKNLLLFGDDAQTADFGWGAARFAGDSRQVSDCDAGYDWVAALEARFGPLVLIPHHPAGIFPMPVDWTCHDPTWEVAAEVYSAHGAALSVGSDFDPSTTGVVAEGTVHYAVGEAGARLGFLASTDHHNTHPGEVCWAGDTKYGGGLAVAVLEAGERLDRASLGAAIMSRRTYGTSGPALPVVVDYFGEDDRRLGGMGAHIGQGASPRHQSHSGRHI